MTFFTKSAIYAIAKLNDYPYSKRNKSEKVIFRIKGFFIVLNVHVPFTVSRFCRGSR